MIFHCLQQSTLEKYSISKVSFSQIFTGNPPDFALSKKLLKSPSPNKPQSKPGSANNKLSKSLKKPSPDKKGQQSMDKFVKKTDKAEGILVFYLLFWFIENNTVSRRNKQSLKIT